MILVHPYYIELKIRQEILDLLYQEYKGTDSETIKSFCLEFLEQAQKLEMIASSGTGADSSSKSEKFNLQRKNFKRSPPI
jgi:hypothetical protein